MPRLNMLCTFRNPSTGERRCFPRLVLREDGVVIVYLEGRTPADTLGRLRAVETTASLWAPRP